VGDDLSRGGPIARHPSQLYEAVLEGIVLFIVLFVLATTSRRDAGQAFSAALFLPAMASRG
jgi:phosphatidylglycerol:prolipoprotein diacylglycerol transferase